MNAGKAAIAHHEYMVTGPGSGHQFIKQCIDIIMDRKVLTEFPGKG